MSEIPADLKYAKSHEWIRLDEDGRATVGISDYAQGALGDLVFVELPEAGETLTAGDTVAVVESVKAASDVYAPLSGDVIEVNPQLADAPELINDDPYGEGWLLKMSIADESGLDDLLDPDAYEQVVADEEG